MSDKRGHFLAMAVEVLEQFPGLGSMDEISDWWFYRGQSFLDYYRDENPDHKDTTEPHE
jgi:hypothetical protein